MKEEAIQTQRLQGRESQRAPDADFLPLADARRRADLSFWQFCKEAWPALFGKRPFKDVWALECIAEHLEAVVLGEIRDLLINIPPQTGKSTITSVFWHPYIWTFAPWLRFLCNSYDIRLSTRDTSASRRLIYTDWYQERWGDKFAFERDQNLKMRYLNTQTGARFAASPTGGNTGEPSDIILCDDPNNVTEALREEKTEMLYVQQWWSEVMSSRLTDQDTGCRVIIQQRIDEDDLTGYLLREEPEGWHHLRLPMEYERRTVHPMGAGLPAARLLPPEAVPPAGGGGVGRGASSGPRPHSAPSETGFGLPIEVIRFPAPLERVEATIPNAAVDDGEQEAAAHVLEPHDWCEVYPDVRTQEGELLMPERFSAGAVRRLQIRLGTRYAGQYQQRPAPREGVVFDVTKIRPLPDWFDVPYEDGRSFREMLPCIEFWDTADSEKESADFTASSTFRVDPQTNLYLSHVWKGKPGEKNLPFLMAEHLCITRPDLVCIEKRAFDRGTTQDLIRNVITLLAGRHACEFRAVDVRPDGDKVARARLPAGRINLGMFFVDMKAPWWPSTQRELISFPKGRHDDVVDTISGGSKAAIEYAGIPMATGGTAPHHGYGYQSKKRDEEAIPGGEWYQEATHVQPVEVIRYGAMRETVNPRRQGARRNGGSTSNGHVGHPNPPGGADEGFEDPGADAPNPGLAATARYAAALGLLSTPTAGSDPDAPDPAMPPAHRRLARPRLV